MGPNNGTAVGEERQGYSGLFQVWFIYLLFLEELYNVRARYLSVTIIMFEVEVDAAEEWTGLHLKVKSSYIFQTGFSTKINVDI